jgi:hypothetical protein
MYDDDPDSPLSPRQRALDNKTVAGMLSKLNGRIFALDDETVAGMLSNLKGGRIVEYYYLIIKAEYRSECVIYQSECVICDIL